MNCCCLVHDCSLLVLIFLKFEFFDDVIQILIRKTEVFVCLGIHIIVVMKKRLWSLLLLL